MEKIGLHADHRETLGKKVRFLRRQGVTPAHLFGRGLESLALQCNTHDLSGVLNEAGRTRLIELKVGKARKPRMVVVRDVQRNTRTGDLLHVDLYQVRMEEEIKVSVPIMLVGEAPALKSKGNMLVHELDALEIECLPDRIPASIEVELSPLEEAEQSILVKDIDLGEGITVLENPERVVARIMVLPTERVEEEEAAVAEELAVPAEVPSEAGVGGVAGESEGE